jgi:hypothetical protein
MDEIKLTDDQRDALVALRDAAKEYPEADGFEHDRNAVVMPGARHDVQLRIERETLRRLGHLGAVDFTRERDGFGRGRWTFVLTARAADFV